jgi:hypothetical protein
MHVELTKRTALVLLVLLTVLAGAGIGLIQDGGDGDAGPAPPTVTVTPPGDGAVEDGTERDGDTGSLDGATTETPDGGDSSGTDAGGDTADGETTDAEPTLSVTAAAADPAPVRHATGSVDRLEGTVRTDASWTGRADTAVVVYSVWAPDFGWTEATRRTVDVTGASTLPADAADETLTYATGRRASAFENPRDGTTRTTEGHVAVTVVLFDGGDEVARERVSDPFAVAVTNLGSAGGSAGASASGGGDAGAGEASDPVELAVGGADDAPIRIGGVAPGDSGVVQTAVRNDGTESGRLTLRVANVTDAENDLLEPERDAGDTDETGELSGAVSVRVSVGEDYLVGDEGTWVRLSELDTVAVENTTLRAGETRSLDVEWRVDAAVGNEIQSDSTIVDVTLVLSQTS